RFGGLLSGLVVPGYIVPLLVMKPWAAAVVCVEACLTYAIVWCFSEYLSQWGRWSNFFGRDRFFALVLCSVLIRLIFDALILPDLGAWLNSRWNWQFDYRSNLHSFGLIIIAMMANQFWKTGFARALPQVATTCAITYVIVRYGLMEYTNFTMSNLGYMYEDFAASILGSPKAYIIVLTTALLSSRLNLHYGWDFNGILVPSLIALQWSQPLKIFTSFVETYCILVMANFILQAPIFRRMTIEGGRKLLLFFNISFAYKMLLGYVIVWCMPQVKVTDFFGFGYLLPTLMAVKMHDKDIIARLTRATLQTSFAAVLMACIIGFSLTHLPSLRTWPSPATAEVTLSLRHLPHTELIELIRKDKASLYQSQFAQDVTQPLPHEIDIFTAAIRTLQSHIESSNTRLLQRAQDLLSEVNYQIDVIQDRYLYLHENDAPHGWGSYVLDLQASAHELLIEVPTPLDDRPLLEAATQFFITHSGRGLAIAGIDRWANSDASVDMLRTPQSFFHAFHKEMARDNVLQIRADKVSKIQAPRGRRLLGELHKASLSSRLWVKSTLPIGLDLVRLKALVSDFRIHWTRPPWTNVQREATRTGFAELFLTTSSLHRLLFHPIVPNLNVGAQLPTEQFAGSLSSWLLQDKTHIAPSGTDLYKVPKLEDLLLFDAEILTPITQLTQRQETSQDWSELTWNDFHTIALAAQTYGYRLIHLRSTLQEEYAVLAEKPTEPTSRRHWGTYIWRIGNAEPYLIQAPHPLLEINSLNYAMSLFNRLRGRALFISGAHPKANRDGSADVIAMRNARSLFNLAYQVLLRESDATPMMAVQSRGLSAHSEHLPVDTDAVIAFASGTNNADVLSPLGQQLLAALEQEGLRVRFVDGALETVGYESSGIAQAHYLDATSNKELVLLWLTAQTRRRYRQQSQNRWQEAQFNALHIPTLEADLSSYIAEQSAGAEATPLPDALQEHLMRYIRSQDIIYLRQLIRDWPSYQFERLLDMHSQQAYVLVYRNYTELALIANLSPKTPDTTVRTVPGRQDGTDIRQFVDTHARWLEWAAE
ncbi:MAG: poly-gamma-glutamate biosynthesis protein PgsC/CapC, partial [Candidatus Tectomicrobia bacterium]|nr:poly-gamma-glutamate biosynthesis protein PgsC/CapC [Candidatus Tectomicrobia bacterium]